MNSQDIETGQEVQELIQTGEFFGVKSALGRYPREESALVLSNAEVLQFSVPEFEQFVSTNTRVIMKMMKVFSNQLRRIHTRVNSLLNIDEKSDPEKSLFSIGEYYLKKRKYPQALHVFRSYLTYYPSGKFANEAAQNSRAAEQYGQKYGVGKGPVPPVSERLSDNAVQPQSAGEKSVSAEEAEKIYYNAVSIFSQNKYEEAMQEFKKIEAAGDDGEYSIKALHEIGRCLFHLKQYDQGIKHFSALLQRYPKMPDLPEALFCTGQCYEAKNDKEKAVGFYKKILSMTQEDDPTHRKATKAMRALEGKK